MTSDEALSFDNFESTLNFEFVLAVTAVSVALQFGIINHFEIFEQFWHCGTAALRHCRRTFRHYNNIFNCKTDCADDGHCDCALRSVFKSTNLTTIWLHGKKGEKTTRVTWESESLETEVTELLLIRIVILIYSDRLFRIVCSCIELVDRQIAGYRLNRLYV